MNGEPVDRADDLALALDAEQRGLVVDGAGEVVPIALGIAVEGRLGPVGACIAQRAAVEDRRSGSDIVVGQRDRLDDAVDDPVERTGVEALRRDVVEQVVAVPARTAVRMRRGQDDIAGGVLAVEAPVEGLDDRLYGRLEEHPDVGDDVHDALRAVGEHERPGELTAQDPVGPLVRHPVAHHACTPRLAGDVGDAAADLKGRLRLCHG